MDWASHEATANVCGGHLASVTSSTELDLVIDQWGSDYATTIWLRGYQDDNTCTVNANTDCWEFSDGSPWWYDWGAPLLGIQQPNNLNGNQTCLDFYVEPKAYNDRECDRSQKGIYIFDADIELFGDGSCWRNYALGGTATQSSLHAGYTADRAIDGETVGTDPHFTHTRLGTCHGGKLT